MSVLKKHLNISVQARIFIRKERKQNKELRGRSCGHAGKEGRHAVSILVSCDKDLGVSESLWSGPPRARRHLKQHVSVICSK